MEVFMTATGWSADTASSSLRPNSGNPGKREGSKPLPRIHAPGLADEAAAFSSSNTSSSEPCLSGLQSIQR